MTKFDVVIWGATGFTGRLVADYLVPKAKVAIAGRNANKLEEVQRAFSEKPEMIIADSFDKEALRNMVKQAKVVCSTVGPYARYGTPLVEVCAEEGAAYCDLTGEPHWIKRNIDALQDRAASSGARIVHCCGFDSIPSDLGCWMLHQHLQQKHQRSLAKARLVVKRIKGGFSGGTVASMMALVEDAKKDPAIRKAVGDPYSLLPKGGTRGPDGSDQRGPRYDDALGVWTGPFVMATINTRVVRRSNALMDYAYGAQFGYGESMATGPGPKGRLRAMGIAAGFGGFAAAATIPPAKRLLERYVLPAPGEGPNEGQRTRGMFAIELIGQSDDPNLGVRGQVGDSLDPGYGSTAKMLGESALELAQGTSNGRAGILTPASAMGDALIARLRAAGMVFDVKDA